jgi:uncharacterized protein
MERIARREPPTRTSGAHGGEAARPNSWYKCSKTEEQNLFTTKKKEIKMSLTEKVNKALTEAMKAKDETRKRAIRDIKAQLLLQKTDGSGMELTEEMEVKILQKMVKQREESLSIYEQQKRDDLAEIERGELAILREFLPTPLTEAELSAIITAVIAQVGATSMKDMGKVVAETSKQTSGKADGKTVAGLVKKLLS